MLCPKCKTSTLSATTVKETQVDQCRTCKGLWFDERELSALLAADAPALRPLARGNDAGDLTARRGDCPRDGTAMLRVFSAMNRNVVVDTCPACRGIWLDGGELAALVGA
ncbi:zf-TFIIB domain-containing protein [Candidatus Binatia bacterium]|nr:zf-TFIIB domain-containing protein [Candidatus Binatia bacterium]